MKDLVEIRRDLHQIPELGYEEFKTQEYLLTYLRSLPQEHMEIKTWRTGIIVKINGLNPSKKIGWRTDIDGLPIEEKTDLPFSSQHSGRMHACGHDLHMTIALGVVKHFASQPVDDDLVFLFQPAEEGPGGAEPMMASEELREWMPDEIYALHIAPEYPAGTIATKPGLLFANTSELFIDLYGKGGHAAYPHETKDMLVAAAYFVTQLQSIVSRNVDPLDSAVVTIGKMTAGTVQNVIADHARLEGTIRTLSPEAMEKTKARVQALLKGIEVAFDCRAEIDNGSGYYQVFNDPEVTGRFTQFASLQSDINFVHSREAMTGEDFGFMLKKIPGLMFWLGVGSDHGLHHAKLNPDEQAIEIAANFIIRYFNELGRA